MTVATNPLGGQYDISRIFTGYSKQLNAIDDQIIETQVRLKEAASNQPLIPALIRLQSIVTQFSTRNWDGYGALPVSGKAYKEAEDFIFLLADGGLPMPDISPEVDGGIELEWYKNADAQFTVSLDGKKLLVYSGLFENHAETFGVEPFNESIPSLIQGSILRIYSEYWDFPTRR